MLLTLDGVFGIWKILIFEIFSNTSCDSFMKFLGIYNTVVSGCSKRLIVVQKEI